MPCDIGRPIRSAMSFEGDEIPKSLLIHSIAAHTESQIAEKTKYDELRMPSAMPCMIPVPTDQNINPLPRMKFTASMIAVCSGVVRSKINQLRLLVASIHAA